jgi:hypothetical protein
VGARISLNIVPANQMISKKFVVSSIDSAEVEFRKAWKILALMKTGKLSRRNIKSLFDFQPILCCALQNLETAYQSISAEKRRLITRKRWLSDAYFRKRAKTLDSFLEAIEQAVALGKSLGDAFAWFFYQRDRKLLDEHRKAPRMLHGPFGSGAQGELEFIRNCKRFAGDLVLYHGTTTLLRHGDVSLIDTKALKVTAIGELKTQRISKNRLQMSLTLLSKTPAKHFLKNLPMLERSPMDASPKFADRLKRQTARITNALKDPPPLDQTIRLQLEHTAHLRELSEMLAELESKPSDVRRVGDGLVLAGLNFPKRKYSSLLFRFDPTEMISKAQMIKPIVHEIVDGKAGDENTALVGTFQAMDPKRLDLLPGLTPLFWWPIKIEHLEKLFFLKAIVLTVFNPLHLRRKFEAAGFAVTRHSGSPYFSLRKTVEGREMKVVGMPYCFRLVTDHLFSERSVVDLIERNVDSSLVKQLPRVRTCHIQTNIEQHF